MTGAEMDLWHRWKTRKDRDALQRLVATHEAFVHDFARRVCGHDADAEDIAQEAFLELAEAPLDRPLKVGLRAFLGRRIVLASKTLKRAALSRRAKEAQAPPPVEHHPAYAEAEEALALLDDEEREAVVLRFLHGFSCAEVSEALAISEGAARVRVHRALQRLRARLGPRAEGAIAVLPLFFPAKTFSRAAAGAAALNGGAVVMTASANRYLIVALVLLALVAGLVTTRILSSKTVSRTVTRTPGESQPVSEASDPVVGGSRGSRAPDAEPSTAEAGNSRASEPDQATAQSLIGHLRFVDGTPVRGMRLHLETCSDDVTTSEDGRFEFNAPIMVPNKLYQVGPDDYMLSLAPVPDEAKDIVIERGLVLRGGVVMERTAEPVSGALLELTCPGAAATRTVQAAWGKARSDAEGHFAFEHLLPATYQVTLTATGIEPRVESVDASEGSPPLEIVVRPTRDMTVCLADAPPCVLRGKVTGHDSGLGSR